MTLVDSLDTLWLMGLRAEFDEAFAPSPRSGLFFRVLHFGNLETWVPDFLQHRLVWGSRQSTCEKGACVTQAVGWVKSSLRFDRTGDVSVFETTIRELGGPQRTAETLARELGI